MQIVWFLAGFLCCAVPGMLAIVRARRIRAAAQAADPWLNPPTVRAKRLLAVTREQLNVVVATEASAPPVPLPEGAALLPFLTPRNGVVFFHNGVAVLPYGSEARVNDLADTVVSALQDAYVALREASGLVDEHIGSMHAAERAVHPNPLVRAVAYDPAEAPLDELLQRLATLLEVETPHPVGHAAERR